MSGIAGTPPDGPRSKRVESPDSGIASQGESEGSLLKQIQIRRDYNPRSWSPTGFFKARAVTQEYRQTLEGRFENAQGAFAKLSLEELQILETISNKPALKGRLQGAMNQARAETMPTTIQNFLFGINFALKQVSHINIFLGGRMTKGDTQDLTMAIGEIAMRDPAAWPTFAQAFHTFMEAAERGEPDYQAQSTVTQAALESTEVRNVMKELLETVVLANSQIVHENTEACYEPPNTRTLPTLTRRNHNISYSLLREQHPPIELQQMKDDDTVDLSLYTTEVHITHPRTLETRTLRVHLPFGKMTVREAKEELAKVKRFISKGERGFPPEDVRRLGPFVKQMEDGLGAAIKYFSGVGQKAAGRLRDADSLDSSQRAQLALLNAAEGNIFIEQDGNFALVEHGARIPHFISSYLPEEWAAIRDGESAFSVILPTQEGKMQEGRLTLESREGITWGEGPTRYREVTGIISDGNLTVTRKMLYPEGSNNSRLLERDLLLLKSQFIQKTMEG